MIATGQPIDEIEDELRAIGRHFGYPDLQVGAGPTGIYLGLASGEPATFASLTGGLRLDQPADVRLIRHLVATDQLGVEPALQRLHELPGKPPRYPRWLADLGFVGVAVGICLILQPALPNVAAALLSGAIVVGLSRLAQRVSSLLPLLPTVAAFVVSCLVFAAADAGLLEGALRTVLPPLAVLLPGALMV